MAKMFIKQMYCSKNWKSKNSYILVSNNYFAKITTDEEVGGRQSDKISDCAFYFVS